MDMKQFGKNIRVIRGVLDMSAAEFGSKIGLTRQAINNYESGRTIPKLTIKMAIIGYLYQSNAEHPYAEPFAMVLEDCFTRKMSMTTTYETID